MFNRTMLQSGPSHISVDSHITERRAPTDDSVALLREMETAMERKWLSSTRLQDNIIDAVWHVFDDPSHWDMRVLCSFKINGQDGAFEMPLDRIVARDSNVSFDLIFKRLTEEVPKVIFESLLRSGDHIRTLVKNVLP